MIILDDMALFVEVVKARGFRKAAEVIGMPNSTLSRRITELEKAIGLRLLHRTTRRIELTEAGQLYFERCKQIVNEARLAHEQLGEMLAQPTGVLRVSLPVDFAVTYLSPLIAKFSVLYPGITFELDLSPRRVDLISEPFDVAIRMGESESSQLISRPLMSLTPGLYASPGYLKKFGEPREVNDLINHECLSILKGKQWILQSGQTSINLTVNGKFLINSIGMIRRLATLDMGIILVEKEIVLEELTRGKLLRILPEWQGESKTVYALTETRLLPAKTELFLRYLKEQLAFSSN